MRRTRVALGAACLAFVIVGACGEDTGEATRSRPPVRVETVRASAVRLQETVRGIGTLRAAETVEIRAETSGLVIDIHFEEGNPVEAGQLLYTLDDGKLTRERAARSASLKQARARLRNARTRFARVAGLYRQNAASREEYDRGTTDLRLAEAEVEGAEAALQLVEEQLADTRIYAPFAGPVSESRVDRGDYVRTGDHLATLYQSSPLEIEFRIPERYAGRIERGQPVEVIAASVPGQRFAGSVGFVSPAVDEQARDFLVKAAITNADGRLKPGSFATALVTVAVREGNPVVPEEALVSTREGYLLFVVEDGVARSRRVRVGLRTPGVAEVVGGLAVGDVVVRSGHMQIASGDAVRSVPTTLTGTEAPEEDDAATADAGRRGDS